MRILWTAGWVEAGDKWIMVTIDHPWVMAAIKAAHESNCSKRSNFESLDWKRLNNRTLGHNIFSNILEFVCAEMFPINVGCD